MAVTDKLLELKEEILELKEEIAILKASSRASEKLSEKAMELAATILAEAKLMKVSLETKVQAPYIPEDADDSGLDLTPRPKLSPFTSNFAFKQTEKEASEALSKGASLEDLE